MKTKIITRGLSYIFAITILGICAVPTTAQNIVIEEKQKICSDGLNLTQYDVRTYYDAFLESRNAQFAERANESNEIDEFVQYAVDQGIILDTAEQREALTKEGYRLLLTPLVTIGNEAGLYTAATLLSRPLQDVPGNFVKNATSGYAIELINCDEIQELISEFSDYVRGENLQGRTISGSVALESTLNLELAYHLVDYVIYGTNKNGTWSLTIRITDEYDFDYIAWKEGMSAYSAAVSIINNYAVDAQNAGAIVPYSIMITGNASFTE